MASVGNQPSTILHCFIENRVNRYSKNLFWCCRLNTYTACINFKLLSLNQTTILTRSNDKNRQNMAVFEQNTQLADIKADADSQPLPLEQESDLIKLVYA